MKLLSVVFIIFSLFGTFRCSERSLPSFIEKCKASDPDVKNCIIKHGNKVIPLLRDGDSKHRIIAFDPLILNEAIIEPSNNLKLNVKDIKIGGLSTGKITEAGANLQDGFFYTKIFIPVLDAIGDYSISGKLVFLPITGEGQLNITYTNIYIDTKVNFKKEEINNIEQVVIQKIDVEYKADKAYFKFGNLFNGDPVLEQQMTKFIEENSVEVDKEFHKDFCDIMSKIIKNALSNMFKDIPFNNVFLP